MPIFADHNFWGSLEPEPDPTEASAFDDGWFKHEELSKVAELALRLMHDRAPLLVDGIKYRLEMEEGNLGEIDIVFHVLPGARLTNPHLQMFPYLVQLLGNLTLYTSHTGECGDTDRCPHYDPNRPQDRCYVIVCAP